MKWNKFKVAALGLAALCMAAGVRADGEEFSAQDSAEELRASLGDMTARMNAMEAAGKMKIEVKGFVETDIFSDDTRSFTEVVGNGAVALGGVAGGNGYTQFSVRNSRLSFLGQTEVGGWKTKGYSEFDLLGFDPSPAQGVSTPSGASAPPSEGAFYTNPTLRVRHAYLDAQKDGWDLLAGQYWTLLGWNMDYTLATVSVAPVMGVLYQRTPQVRVGKTFFADGPVKIQFAADAERPVERESAMPNFNQGIRFIVPGWQGRYAPATGAANAVPMSLAISGDERKFAWQGDAGYPYLDTSTWGQALAVDGLLPILPFDGKDSCSLIATGEWSAGNGYGDAFPSWSGGAGALTAATGNPDLDSGLAFVNGKDFTLVEMSEWNAQLQFHLPPSIGSIVTAGYGQVSSPNLYLIAGPKVYDRDSAIFANIMQDITANIRVGLEYDCFNTHYIGTAKGPDGVDATDHRMQFSTWYRF